MTYVGSRVADLLDAAPAPSAARATSRSSTGATTPTCPRSRASTEAARARIRGAPPSVDTILAALALRQHGVLALAQLLAAGLSRSAIGKRVGQGRLHRIYRGVYAVGHRALSQEGRWLAAVIAAGDGAALSHLSAAELRQLRRYHSLSLDVIVPRKRRPIRGIHIHVARSLDQRDIAIYRGIPVTTIPRTLVDLSDDLTAPELTNVIHEAAFRKRFNLEATRQAMARANGRHNLHVLEAALQAHADGSAGLRSRLERTFRALVLSAGLPEPIVNTHVCGHEVDFHWPDLKLHVETDGPGHTRPRTRKDDARRDRDLKAAGYQTLRFTDHEIEQDPASVIKLLHVAIAGAAATPRTNG